MGIARSAALNLVGLAAPLPLAVLVVPPLLQGLGDEGFGLLTLFWALTTYASVFDLGLGRALTQKLAIVLNREGPGAVAVGALCSTAFALLAGVGAVVGLLLFFAAGPALQAFSVKDDQLMADAALRLLALSLPLVILGAGFRGALEALNAFGRVNAVRLPLGIWTLLGPWLALQHWGANLLAIAWVLWLARLLACCAWGWMVFRALPGWRHHPKLAGQWLRPLLSTGGWLTVGNVAAPLMGYADRFLVAGLLTVAAAAFYATPQELVSKLWVLPGALMAVMFPALAAQVSSQAAVVTALCAAALRWIVLLCLPVALGLALFSQELLEVWLGNSFAMQAAPALRWMAMGMYVGCLAQVPFTLLQSGDGASTTAKLQVLELPFFVLALYLCAQRWGVTGAALVWATRNAVDAICLFLLSRQRYPALGLWRGAGALLVFLPILSFSGLLIEPWSGRCLWWFASCALLAMACPPRLLRFPKP
jgi:O-antigen/teichoic acid export membrane protein